MKILLIIVTVILAATAAGSGFYIFELKGQVFDLRTELTGALNGINSHLDKSLEETNQTLSGKIDAAAGETKAVKDELSGNISSLDDSLKAYEAVTDPRISEAETRLGANAQDISGLTDRIAANENRFNDTVMQTSELYKKVKDSIVMITDGTRLYGSGFLMRNPASSTGAALKIITAYHVIDGISKIYVTLSDGRTWEAQIKAQSKEADIAVLGFSALTISQLPDTLNLPAVSLGDAGNVSTGDPVFVMGSPGDSENNRLGLDETMTSGIISHVNRTATLDSQRVAALLQFDAPINFGNSGGPLFNVNGEVIGVVIARVDPAVGDGIGLAVSAVMIKKVDDAQVNGKPGTYTYDYPTTGITVTDISPKDIVTNGNSAYSGAKITAAGGAAVIAGLKVGDIITAIDNHPVLESDEFYSLIIEFYKPGDTVTLMVTRGAVTFPVKLAIEKKS